MLHATQVGVVSDYYPRSYATPNSSVQIMPGQHVKSDGSGIVYKPNPSASPAFSVVGGGQERYDVLSIDDAGSAIITQGTPVGVGTGDPYLNAPAFPSGEVAIAIVKVNETVSVLVTEDDITDARGVVGGGVGGGGSLSNNAIINGDMLISQRGTSFASIADNAYSLDRWRYDKVGAMVHTIQQDTDIPEVNFSNSMKIDCTTIDASIGAGDYSYVSQRIEGFNVKPLVGKTITLSFWVKSSKTGVMCVAFGNNGVDRSYVSEVTINAAGVWEKKKVTLDMDYSGGTWNYTNGRGLSVDFVLACGTTFHTTADSWQTGDFHATVNQTNFCDNASNDMWITGVQLELGASNTDFQFVDYKAKLAQCQRYYEEWVHDGQIYLVYQDAYNEHRQEVGFHNFATAKRVKPTLSKTGPWNVFSAVGANGFINGTRYEFYYGGSIVPPNIATQVIVNSTTGCKVHLSAEL